MFSLLFAGRRAVRVLAHATGASIAGILLLPVVAVADDQPPPTPAPPALVPGASFDIDVVAKQLNEARIGIEPKIGASTYTLSQPAIQDLPNGSNTPIDD